MRKAKSASDFLVSIFCFLLAITVLGFTVCSGYSLYNSTNEMIRYNNAMLDIYFNDFMRTVVDLQQFNENMFASNQDFMILSQGANFLTATQRVQSEFNLHKAIQSRTKGNTGITVFNANEFDSYYYLGDNFLGGIITKDTIKTMKDIRAVWVSEAAPPLQCWVSYSTGENKLLMNTFKRGTLYICSMIDVSAYVQDNKSLSAHEGIVFSFFTRDGILTNEEDIQKHGVSLRNIQSLTQSATFNGGVIAQAKFNETSGVGLCGIILLSEVGKYMRVYVLILILVLAVICLLFACIHQTMKKALVYPLNQITKATNQIASGGNTIHYSTESIKEFAEIQKALNCLIEQKVSLAQENLNKERQKEHALLQYYQLQTRSHFIMNCLKSIYGLTVKGDSEKTRRIISAFSNHIRYVFHDSLSWVTIQEEIEEVRDYFGIIEQERNGYMLLNVEVLPELLTFPVPPLIIQTFLENFNKHNAQETQILRFSVRIDKVNLGEKDYIRIRMTDNGIGYSDEAIKSLQSADGIFERNHVGIQNLYQRMDILYKNQYRKAILNAPGGGALSIFYLPLSLTGDQEPETSEVEL